MIAKAVKTALYGGLAASLAISAPATFAAEEEAEKIVVTGSRIKRVDVETAQPVTILTREDIDLSGDTSVADALRNTSANSFGSWKGQSGFGSGATGAAEIDLRGVGATLVLVDGRRMPGSGYDGGATQDLNNIPLAVVERIEILRGGASAIYGSDAIAGVVNIITRKDVEGAHFSALYENTSIDGGGKKQYEFAAGVTGDRGSMLVVLEHQSQDEVADNEISGFDNGVSWWSAVPNATYYDATNGYTDAYDANLCETVPNTVDQGYRCGYAFSNVTWLYPQRDSNSIMTKFTYGLTDSIEFSARLSYVDTETNSRFAPTPVSTSSLTMQYDNPNNPYGSLVDPSADPNTYIYLRTALLGNRDARFKKSSFDATFGLEGSLDSGYDWTLFYQRTLSDETLYNRNLINDLLIQEAVNDGSFDVFNVSGMTSAEWSEHALGIFQRAAHTGLFELEQDRNILDGSFGGEFYSNDTLTASFVVGAELETIKFTQISDPASANGFISGGSGGDDVFASRDRTSAFTEFQVAFDFGLELSTAFRYDKYEQEGFVGTGTAERSFSDTTPMFGVAYRPTDDLLLRATYGEAFRAPTMPELFASNSFGFPSAYDYYYCEPTADGGLGNPGNDIAYCDAANLPQHLTFSGGNPTLSSENADTLTAGVVWNATDDLSFELSYYSIEYFDRITNVSLDDILRLDFESGGTSSNVTREPSGQIQSIQSGTINLERLDTAGFDIGVAYNFDTSIGDWAIVADATFVKEYGLVDQGQLLDRVGRFGLPEKRGNVRTSWSSGDLFASWRMNYIDGQDSTSSSFLDRDAVIYHHLQFGVNTSWDGKFVLGVKNATDEKTQFNTGNPAWRSYDTTLYDPVGRTWFVRYEQAL